MGEDYQSVLVTGGAGYIGSVLVSHLLYKNYRVYVIDDLRYGGHGLLNVCEHPNLIVYATDIRNYVLQPPKIDTIVHLAAIVGKPACFLDEGEARSINFDATCSLLTLAERWGVKQFIFASTCSNYGECDWATEDTELMPLSIYAETKVDSERQVLRSDISVTTVLRFATVYGISPRMRFDLLLNEFVRDSLGNGLVVYGKTSWRPLVHVRDVARAIEMCISKRLGGIFNVGGHNRRKGDIAEELAQYSSKLLIYDEGRDDPRDYKVSFEKIAKHGFTTNHNPEDSIRNMINALRLGLFGDSYDKKYQNN